ncbi:MAG: type II toxin-antitoxin system VapC family toxin [Candidatus Omnitrophica bacterium]|nr:type II toxin-antitoxin system VapC family toxin [Candidatus Omnitrophota bacterium]
MRAFIDTSSLFKKYVEEDGSKELDSLLQEVSEIAVSPITWVEMSAVVARRLRGKSLTSQQAAWLKSEMYKDFQSFHRVVWNESLEKVATDFVYQYSLATLDAIQLASGVLSKAETFVTSDRRLFGEAQKKVRKAVCI